MNIAYAQSTSAIPSAAKDLQGVFDIMCRFAAAFIWTLIILCMIMVLVAAWNFMTSAGQAEKLTKARKLLTYSALGVAIALIASFFPVIVGDTMGYKSPSGAGLTPLCAIFGGTGGSGGSAQ